MTGFIRGLFGSKKQKEEPTPKPSNVDPAVERRLAAYFLNTDDAKTYGNLEYMRTAKKVRRTFPKTAGSQEEKEFIQEVSAILAQIEGSNGKLPITEVKPASESTTPKVDQAAERRRSDPSMDLFRNMARDIRK